MNALIGRLVVGCALMLPALAPADIYRCVGPTGDTTYSDAPCPDSAAMSSNITALLDHCTTAECEAQREQARSQARERLEQERELLSTLTEARLKSEALYLDRLVRLEELRTLEERLALERAQQSEVYYPAYGLGGAWPPFGHKAGAPGFKQGFFGKDRDRRNLERPVSFSKSGQNRRSRDRRSR